MGNLRPESEARNALELPDMYVIQPAHSWWADDNWWEGKKLKDGFRYTSDTNSEWLREQHLQEMLASFQPDQPSVPA